MSEQIAKITWRCRRGMLELDILLHRFIKKQINDLSVEELNIFEDLLSYSDPQIYSWLMGHELPENKELRKIVELIKIQG